MGLESFITGIIGSVAGAGKTLYDQEQNKRLTTDARNYDRGEWDRTYDKTRKDAISDRDYNNKYNSPQQQMIRLKDAGLNPHLVYGNGAQTTASQINDAKPNARNSAPMRAVEQPNIYAASNELALTQAQTAHTQAQTVSELTRGEGEKFDLGLKHELRDTTIAAAKANKTSTETSTTATRDANDRANELHPGALEKQRVDITYTLDSNERAKLSNAMELKKGDVEIKKVIQEIALSKQHELESKQNILRSQKQNSATDAEIKKIDADIKHLSAVIKNVNIDTKLKKWQNEMYSQGMTPSDPAYFRAIIEAFSF